MKALIKIETRLDSTPVCRPPAAVFTFDDVIFPADRCSPAVCNFGGFGEIALAAETTKKYKDVK